MKKRLFIFTICFALMLLLPVISAKNGIAISGESSGANEKATERSSEKSPAGSGAAEEDDRVFRILDTSSGEITEIPDREFCVGALCYELAPSFEPETLKAQTVALYTHFCRLRKAARSDTENSSGADFSADLSAGEFYYSDSQLREKWGSMYDEGIEEIRSAVDDVYSLVLTDENGELIDAAYHAISSGATENAKDIFGKADSHLISAASPGDCFAPDYITQKRLSAEELFIGLSELDGSIQKEDIDESRINVKKRTAAGAVLDISFGGCKFSGDEIRRKFGLRSADFDLEIRADDCIFTVRGYGHGVGMSQWGAQAMALQGADFREILCHYYHDIRITRFSDN